MRIGVNLTSVNVTGEWWLRSARELEAAGYDSIWSWDHFISRGRRSDPVLECWSTLGAAAAVTTRVRVGSFVADVMNRHPSVVARTVASIHAIRGGAVDVGLGVGGNPGEHHALGLPFPDIAERVARVEEAAQVMRLLWAGGPATFEGRYYQLVEAEVAPVSPPPRLIVAGQTPSGARLAARAGDGWTTYAQDLDRLLPVYREALATAGSSDTDAPVVVSMDLVGRHAAIAEAFLADPVGETARWRERGADELILSYARPVHVSALLDAAARAGLAARYEDAR